MVYFGKNEQGEDETLVGSHAEAMADKFPQFTVRSVKRFMGRSRQDIKFNHPYQLVGDDNVMPSIATPQGAKKPCGNFGNYPKAPLRPCKIGLA